MSLGTNLIKLTRIIEEWLKLLQRRSKVIPLLIFLRLGLPTFCQLVLRSQNIISSYYYKLKILSCDGQDCRSKATFVIALWPKLAVLQWLFPSIDSQSRAQPIYSLLNKTAVTRCPGSPMAMQCLPGLNHEFDVKLAYVGNHWRFFVHDCRLTQNLLYSYSNGVWLQGKSWGVHSVQLCAKYRQKRAISSPYH